MMMMMMMTMMMIMMIMMMIYLRCHGLPEPYGLYDSHASLWILHDSMIVMDTSGFHQFCDFD
eukprot:5849707-Karenia_brevis.AAC.1